MRRLAQRAAGGGGRAHPGTSAGLRRAPGAARRASSPTASRTSSRARASPPGASSPSRSPTRRRGRCGRDCRSSAVRRSRARSGWERSTPPAPSSCALTARPSGVKQNFVIYDSADQKAVVSRASRTWTSTRSASPRAPCWRTSTSTSRRGAVPTRHATATRTSTTSPSRSSARTRSACARPTRSTSRTSSCWWRGCSRARAEGDRIRRRYDYVLVDEFQDTNATQYRFLRDLVRDHEQPVRRRRRRPEHLPLARRRRAQHPRLPARLPGGDGRQARAELPLEQAHRRRGARRHLALARARAQGAVDGRTTTACPSTSWPRATSATRRRSWSRPIKRARSEGVDPKEMAVFYRIHAQSRVLEEALRAANVPYQIIGGMKFYERAEVKDALAYLRVLVQPGERRRPRAHRERPRARHRTAPRSNGSARGPRCRGSASSRRSSAVDAVEDLGAAAKKKLVGLPGAAPRAARAQASRLARASCSTAVLESTGYISTLKKEDNAEADARIENLRGARGLASGLRGRGGGGGRGPDARRLPRARHAGQRRRRDEGRAARSPS